MLFFKIRIGKYKKKEIFERRLPLIFERKSLSVTELEQTNFLKNIYFKRKIFFQPTLIATVRPINGEFFSVLKRLIFQLQLPC